MSIPKIIHYCWFGGSEYPSSVKKCIQSWKKYCPDYKLMLWDEACLSKYDSRFLRQAIELKKWAFAADYIRLMALYEYGGIYLDTDVELVRSPNEFVEHEVFLGFERSDSVASAVIGSVPHHQFIGALAEEYTDRSLLLPTGEPDLTPNVVYITRELVRQGLKTDNSRQVVKGIAVYPCEYFSPKSLDTGRIRVTKNTCAIHHFKASWMPLKNRINTHIAWLLGPTMTAKIKKVIRKSDE